MSTWLGFDACPQFEVGKCQAIELFGPACDMDLQNQIRSRHGLSNVDSYLARALVADDGTYYDWQIVGWFTSVEGIVSAIADETWWEQRFGHTCYFEVFNVVDDGDLWQAWDMEADAAAGDVLAAEAMEAVFGVGKYIQAPCCIVCKDAEYGPWVTVALPIGARYMCEGCFDNVNTVRSVMGKGPIRIARCYS